MKFHAEHLFSGISLASYERLFFDEEFNTALCKSVRLERQLVKRDLVDGKLLREVRISPDREIPGPLAKIIGADKIEYTEHLEYVMGSYRAQWRTQSSVLTDKVDSRGTIGFAEREGRVLRVVDGNINVKIFGVGGIVERFIVADIEKSYERAADFTRTWLASHKDQVGAG